MLIIPGKYIDKDGGPCTVLTAAFDGETGKRTVVYRKSGDGRVLTLDAEKWRQSFHCAEDEALRQYAENGSEAELLRRFTTLFAGRNDVCSLHWRSAFGLEGHNYLCENRSLAPGCMFGSDSCKNCRSGRLTPFSEAVAKAHLDGEMTVGVYPVLPGGGCRFIVLESLSANELRTLDSVCRKFDIPAYGEAFLGCYRLWLFFSAAVPSEDAAALARALISRAAGENTEVSFELFNRVNPAGICAEGSFGRPVILPLGKFRRTESVFVDGQLRPLNKGRASIFAFRSLTRAYLADRLAFIGKAPFDQPISMQGLSFPDKLKIRLESGAGLPLRSIPTGTAAALKLKACVKNPPRPQQEFEPPSPAVSVCFRQDAKLLWLPRGLWGELEQSLSGTGYTVVENRRREKCYFSLAEPPRPQTADAVRTLLKRPEGLLMGPVGSGKTEAVAAVIAELRTPALILTADEVSRRRWVENVYRLLGCDAEKAGSRIDVLLASDEKIKDKYGLVILTDCSRVPLDHEIFARLSSLSPAYFYGITADDRRRDGLWRYISLLCGTVVHVMERDR